jgi:chromosome segregation ATPase
MKEEFETSSQNKDHKLGTLEIRLENMQKELLKSRDLINEERAVEAEAENRNLRARLELAHKKIENISANFDSHESEVLIKKDREIDSLKTSLSKTQAIIDRFKQDRLQYEARIEEFNKLKEEQQAASPLNLKQDLQDRDNIIQSLSNEKKLFDERIRAQGIELKKAEQKIKFVTSQMETLNKKKGNATKGSEVHTKQIEQLTNRAAEITADLSEKKKEIHKLKQENSAMSNKMTELEKKLSFLDKKAS